MKDLRYILIDYRRYKDLEVIEKFKKNIGSSIAIAMVISFGVGFLILAGNIKSGISLAFNIIVIIILLLLFLVLIILVYINDGIFSMFGPYPQLKMIFMKKTKEEIITEAEETRKRKKISVIKSSDRVPEWFEKFLKEKGINENNIDLLISELKEKYDYNISNLIFGISGWIVSFYGWDNFIQVVKNRLRNKSLLSIIISVTLLVYSIYSVNDVIMRKKGALHPLIYYKRRKNEFLHDLELIKVEWSMLQKQREKKYKLIYKK